MTRYLSYPRWLLCTFGHCQPSFSWFPWYLTFPVLLMTSDHLPSHPQASSPCCLFRPEDPTPLGEHPLPVVLHPHCWLQPTLPVTLRSANLGCLFGISDSACHWLHQAYIVPFLSVSRPGLETWEPSYSFVSLTLFSTISFSQLLFLSV